MVLAKKHEEFINLKDRPETATEALPVMGSPVREAHGPTLYINDVDLPITDDDVDTSLAAEIKCTVRRVSRTVSNGKKSSSFDLEITGIRFKE